MTCAATALLALAALLGPQAPANGTADAVAAAKSRLAELEAELAALRRGEKPGVARIERLGLGRDPAACRTLLPRLLDEGDEIRAAAARALGWCGDAEAVDPLIASLGVFGWSEVVEAALFRLDPGWRTRPAVRRTFDEVRERWWKHLREPGTRARDAERDRVGEADPLFGNSWSAPGLLLRLDEERAKEAMLERLALPAEGDDCNSGLWALDAETLDPAFLDALERSIARAPDGPCLQDAAPLLDRLRPEWHKGDGARAAAEVYALRLTSGSPQEVAEARRALVLLGDSRALEPDATTPAIENLDALSARARNGDANAVAVLLRCSLPSAEPQGLRRDGCVRALGELGRADLVDTYRAILAEPPPPEATAEHQEPSRPESTQEEAVAEPDAEGPEAEEGLEGDPETLFRRMEADPSMQRYRWVARRVDAVGALGRALGTQSLAELQRMAADPNEEVEVVTAIVEVAAQGGPEWSRLLTALATRDDNAGQRAVQALVDRGGRDALPLLWAALSRALAAEDQGRAQQIVEHALRVAPEETIDRLRGLAPSQPSAYPLLASLQIRQGLLATPDELLDTLASLLRPSPDARDDETRRTAIGDLLEKLAEAPPITHSRLPTLDPLTHDRDPRVRALATYLLWKAQAGH